VIDVEPAPSVVEALIVESLCRTGKRDIGDDDQRRGVASFATSCAPT